MDKRGILDDMDTSSPTNTPTDAEDIAYNQGRVSNKISGAAKAMIAIMIGFFVVVFILTFFIYSTGGKDKNLLESAIAESTATPASALGTERISTKVLSVVPIQSQEQRQAMVTPTKDPNITPTPGPTFAPYAIDVTDYYTGANLKIQVTDTVGNVPTPQGGGTPEPLLTAPIQNVTLKMVFYNKDGTAAGSWIDSVGPIPLNGQQEFDIHIPTKPGVGKWDGPNSGGTVAVTTYAILSEP